MDTNVQHVLFKNGIEVEVNVAGRCLHPYGEAYGPWNMRIRSYAMIAGTFIIG